MKRTRIIGLALMAVFAVSAVGTSAAFAVSEFKTASFPVTFTGKGDGLSKFESPSGSTVTCEKSLSFGTLKSALTAEVEITYEECTLKATSPIEVNDTCPSILTLVLSIAPVDKLNLGTKTGVLISPKAGSSLAHFTCGEGLTKVSITVKGSLICESQPIGLSTIKGLIGCRQGANLGEQEFKTATNSSGVDTTDLLTAEATSLFKTTESDAQITDELVFYAKAVEQSS